MDRHNSSFLVLLVLTSITKYINLKRNGEYTKNSDSRSIFFIIKIAFGLSILMMLFYFTFDDVHKAIGTLGFALFCGSVIGMLASVSERWDQFKMR